MAVGGLLSVLVSPAAPAGAATVPLTDPVKAAALAAKIGDDRTGGVYYEDGRLIVAVTDQAAAQSVRNAGGTAKVVTYSAASLDSIHAELDQLAGIPNTSWGADPSTNQVSVDIYDGVSAADRARIESVAAAHGDAVRIEEHSGKLKSTAYEMRGGIGITSPIGTTGYVRVCSSAFNVENMYTGVRYMLTAGHCVSGGLDDWYRRSNGVYLGDEISFECEPGDWAIVKYNNADVTAYGTIQYKDGTAGQITNARYVVDGETVKRVGTTSQDLVGMVLEPSTTVNYADEGVTLYNMIKTTLCDMGGDSGGSLFTGTTALGITSGGNYTDQACGDYDDQSDRVSYYDPVWKMMIDNDLRVY